MNVYCCSAEAKCRNREVDGCKACMLGEQQTSETMPSREKIELKIVFLLMYKSIKNDFPPIYLETIITNLVRKE